MSVNKKERVPHPPAKAPTACESTDWLDEHRHGNAMTYSSLALIGGNPVAPTSALFRPAKLARRPASLPPRSTSIGSHPRIILFVKRDNALWLGSPYADNATYFSKFSCALGCYCRALPSHYPLKLDQFEEEIWTSDLRSGTAMNKSRFVLNGDFFSPPVHW